MPKTLEQLKEHNERITSNNNLSKKFITKLFIDNPDLCYTAREIYAMEGMDKYNSDREFVSSIIFMLYKQENPIVIQVQRGWYMFNKDYKFD